MCCLFFFFFFFFLVERRRVHRCVDGEPVQLQCVAVMMSSQLLCTRRNVCKVFGTFPVSE